MKRVNDGDQLHSIPRVKMRKITLDICTEVSNAQLFNDDGIVKIIDDNINRIKNEHPWLTNDMVRSKLQRLKSKGIKLGLTSLLEDSLCSGVDRVITNAENCLVSGGRPKGSGVQNKILLENKIMEAKNRIAVLCDKKRKQSKKGKLEKNEYKKIHDDTLKDIGLDKMMPTFSVPWKTINTRLLRKRLVITGRNVNKKSPMAAIEPVILQVVLWKQEANQPITPTEGLQLSNSLIEGKPIQEEIKKNQLMLKREPTGILSKTYWKLFMRRHKHAIESKRGGRIASNRAEWVTYENIKMMYDLIYSQMIEAGIAVSLPEDEWYWVNNLGLRVDNEEESSGLKVKIKLTHPEWLLFGDEVGNEMNQKDDKNVEGRKYLVKKNSLPKLTGSNVDARFTAIGLTAASGDPVMCVIIFAAEELTFSQQMGHDIRIPFDDNKSVKENSGKGKTFPGSPKCYFRGKEVEAFVTCTPKGSVTSDILKQVFERLDNMGMYERVDGRVPMALFDAHDLRLQVPFLQYINDKNHIWKFCIGLPNGTHKWQVGDSKQQNGRWKIEWYKEKDDLVSYKRNNGLGCNLDKSDIMPIVSRIWDKSFANKEGNKKAIRERGWNPLSYNLLKDPEILATRANFSLGDENNEVTATVNQTSTDVVVQDNAVLNHSPSQSQENTTAILGNGEFIYIYIYINLSKYLSKHFCVYISIYLSIV